MNNYKIKNRLFTTIGSLFIFLNSCSLFTEPDQEKIFLTIGQLESDMDNAILKTDGTVWTWGNNSTGQLGNGTLMPSEIPEQIFKLKNIVAIDFCEGAAVAGDGDGNIWFWGNRLIWEEPPGYDTTVVVPKKISFLPEIKQLQIRGTYVHALCKNGKLWQLKWNHNTPTEYHIPDQINGMYDIKMISNDLALLNNGTLCEFPERIWVEPENGGLENEVIYDVKEVQNIYMSHTIILKKDSTVWAWGKNKGGYLGNGTYADNPIPSRIDTLNEITSISANSSRCLALKKDGTVWFWGMIDEEKYLNSPIQIDQLEDVKMIYASPVAELLFMKNDGSYWAYNIKTIEIKRIQI